jgi:hypothetical protein
VSEPLGSPAVRGVRPALLRALLPLWLLPLCLLPVLVAACGAAGVQPGPPPSASGSPLSSPSAAPSSGTDPMPPDGYGLRAFGVENGPARFFLPRGSIASTVVDQPNNVVLVLTAPTPAEVGAYLARTLPGAGFRLVDENPEDGTFTFAGDGWTGSFTSGDGVAAVLLRPR